MQWEDIQGGVSKFRMSTEVLRIQRGPKCHLIVAWKGLFISYLIMESRELGFI